MLYGWAAGLGWAGLAGLGLGETSAKTTKIWHREKCFKFLCGFNYCGVFDAYEGGLLGSEMQFSIVFFISFCARHKNSMRGFIWDARKASKCVICRNAEIVVKPVEN